MRFSIFLFVFVFFFPPDVDFVLFCFSGGVRVFVVGFFLVVVFYFFEGRSMWGRYGGEGKGTDRTKLGKAMSSPQTRRFP